MSSISWLVLHRWATRLVANVRSSSCWVHKSKARQHLRIPGAHVLVNPFENMIDSGILLNEIQQARGPIRRGGFGVRHQRMEVGGKWQCITCGELKAPEDYYLRKNMGIRSSCKACERSKSHYYRRTLRGNAQQLASNARRRDRLRGKFSTLSHEDVLDMLWSQGGRCFYSGVPMECVEPNSHWRMSLERLQNDLGYIRENSVLVAAEFNTADNSKRSCASRVHGTAQWSKEKVHDVPVLRRVRTNVQSLLASIEEVRNFQPTRHIQIERRQRRKANLCDEWRCSKCGLYRPRADFYVSQRSPDSIDYWCKDCRFALAKTLRGNAQRTVAAARYRAAIRGHACELTVESIMHMLWEQGGRCYYSGVPMEYILPNSHWRMSLERFDNEKGYISRNCALVAAEYNTPDYSHNNTTNIVYGTAQWSRAKVAYIWGAWEPECLPHGTKDTLFNDVSGLLL